MVFPNIYDDVKEVTSFLNCNEFLLRGEAYTNPTPHVIYSMPFLMKKIELLNLRLSYKWHKIKKNRGLKKAIVYFWFAMYGLGLIGYSIGSRTQAYLLLLLTPSALDFVYWYLGYILTSLSQWPETDDHTFPGFLVASLPGVILLVPIRCICGRTESRTWKRLLLVVGFLVFSLFFLFSVNLKFFYFQ